MSRFSRVRRVCVTGSTNEEIARVLGDEGARGLTLVADYQTHGVGRKGRPWIAPPGSALLCTIALPDAIPSKDLWLAPFWTGLVIADALRRLGTRPHLQWPNDVLLDGRKVAGILCVSRVIGQYAWVGCGIGVNVHRPPAPLAAVEPPPAFLSDTVSTDRDRLLDEVLRCADRMYDALWQPDSVRRDWEIAAGLPHTRYRIALDGGAAPFEATAIALRTGGSLLVDDGAVQREIALADARVLR